MKLYTTTTAGKLKDGQVIEVSKGQGSNHYTTITVQNEAQKAIYKISFVPLSSGEILQIDHVEQCAGVTKAHGGGYFIEYTKALKTLEQAKGEKKTGEQCVYCRTTHTGYEVCPLDIPR